MVGSDDRGQQQQIVFVGGKMNRSSISYCCVVHDLGGSGRWVQRDE